jgi:hypothetical protein
LLQVQLIFCLGFDRTDARECCRDDRWVMLIQWANLNGSERFPLLSCRLLWTLQRQIRHRDSPAQAGSARPHLTIPHSHPTISTR